MALYLLLVLLLCCSNPAILAVSTNVHIVYMGEKAKDDEPQLLLNSHHMLLSSILGSKEAAEESIVYSYKHGFSGFAAILTSSQAQIIADMAGVVAVIPNRIYQLHTTRSWDFLQVNPHLSHGILLKARSGTDSVIGILDSGIWPESASFRDDGMKQVPAHWKGTCQKGQEFDPSHCNRKIIGARWYIKGYEAEFGELKNEDGMEFLSPRDAEGHGTHTSSIAAGIDVENASFLGQGRGTARGGAPSARLAVYKVCWATGGCSSADILAAFDDAIHDGVDVISMSLGSTPPLATFVDDAVSIGSFHATGNGILVVCSGGNSGPFPETVGNTAPWVITVAASTIDRYFPVTMTLGNNQTVSGQSLYMVTYLNEFYPIVYGEDITRDDADGVDASCTSGSLNATLAKGKVLLCFETRTQRSAAAAARAVNEVDGVGLVFAKYPTKEVNLCLDVPCAQVDLTIGTSLLSYIATTSDPVIRFNVPKTEVGHQIAPNVALFSSRGPNSLSPTVLKPDIAAPGVNILASWSSALAAQPSGGFKEGNDYPFKFKFASGTSMACPHVSAVASLLRTIHPQWSPAAIKSAIITTASSTDEYGYATLAEASPHKKADPFDYGGGHIDPNRAIDPGLIYDLGSKDHAQFLCASGYNATAIGSLTKANEPCSKIKNFLTNYNLPAIVVPKLHRSFIVSRLVTNVGPDFSIYTARIEAPAGVDVVVEPSVLVFTVGVKKLRFKVKLCSKIRAMGSYSFGSLIWEDGFHVVKIPLAVNFVV
ncbi:subtilisin-like protease SBT3.6 isoform X2 [Andrographis paniculata]|uniref:subtilisin-like protease SBT3.6 isoform X2 n=1 Tax=Andrographis paniculata TaxID=175694 RepID=UPI0021E700B9|nr:subtilisin-like protease SBT3.6 isoform X2 [Andrographis paniculata]